MILKENFPENTDLEMLRKKGTYPYEYLSSFEKFNETKLPEKTAFFSTLTNKHISDEEYDHALRVWQTFDIRSLGEYHDFYVKSDVILLADVFENFRKLCKQFYDLDPAHLTTLPSLSWQACLKMTDVKLELLTDNNMLVFIEKGVRGGVSQISHRLATANNELCPDYDSSQDKSHIMYWDVNNLYGWSMSQHLPHGGFRWVDPRHLNTEKVLNLKDDDPIGFIFEVHLKYPHELHKLHNEFPLAPEKFSVTHDMLSPYAKSFIQKGYKGVPKLIPNLFDKSKYICHYRNLKLYVQLGLKITGFHKVLQFNQSPWLKKYISFNMGKKEASHKRF